MKTIHKGKIIPNFIVKASEDVVGGILTTRLELVKEFDFTSRLFLRFCMNERDIAAPAMREFFEQTIMVMKVWQDGKFWRAARFKKQEYQDLVTRAEKRGFIVQYGKAKWPTGGGRSAQSAGRLFYADRDVTSELYKKYLGVDTSRMDGREMVARSSILFTAATTFSEKPRLKYTATEMGGIVLVSQDYATRQGIKRGDKLWPIKASAEIVSDSLNMTGADMLVPADAIKFHEHREQPELVAGMMGSIPELSAVNRSSRAKDRVPRVALDTMQWLFPNIQGFLNTDQRVQDRLSLVKNVVEGRASLEEMLSLGEYTNKQGEKAYPMEFNFLAKGQPMEEPIIRDALFRAAATAAAKAICFHVGGGYGVAMPTRGGSKRRLAFCPPWMLPFWVETDMSNPDVIGVDSDWQMGCLGKDYDGDMLIILQIDRLLQQIGMDRSVFPVWDEQKKDENGNITYPTKEWAKKYMALPEKSKSEDKRSVHDVMMDGLEAYGLIGIATNMCMVVLDTMRISGQYTREELMGTYLKMMSTDVQQYVDALKYVPGGLKKPHLKDRIGKKGTIIPGLATKYGVNDVLAERVQRYFKAVRDMDFDELATLPEDESLNGSFYYAIASMFRNWKPVKPVRMSGVAEKLGNSFPVTQIMESTRKRSYVMYKQDVDSRVKELSHLMNTEGEKIALAIRCWAAKDTSLALAIENIVGKRIIDIYKERINAPVEVKSEPAVKEGAI